ncbi:hypothetical protein JCM8115_000406 [Rhodotorula mucilaginosa]
MSSTSRVGAKRRVRCDGMSPCEACLRHAAWKGRPAPTECEYDAGVVPVPNPAVQPNSSAARALLRVLFTWAPGGRMLMMSGDLLTIGSSSASASGNTSPQGGPATAAASGDHELGEVASSFGKHPGKPLQKGLACISCKSRRVKCDGAKPACSSCVKTAKWKREPIQCVYRADLYVQQCRDEEMRQRMGASDVKTEDSDDVCCPPEPAADMSSSTSSLEAMQPDEPQCCPSTLVGVPTVLPAILPPLPPLPPLPVLHTLAHRTKETTPMNVDDPTMATFSSSSTPSFRVARDDSTSFSAPPRPSRASSQSGLTTNPPSPAITHSETDLSSWPSPRSPLDGWCSNLVATYPPVPYPPATSFDGINPAWTEALNTGVIPPLSLSDTLETLGLGAGGGGDARADFDMADLSMPLPATVILSSSALSTPALKSEASFGMETLALPMDTPWISSGSAPLGYE